MNHERAKGFVSFQSKLSVAGLGCVFLLGIGCERAEIHSYRVPRETEFNVGEPQSQAPAREVVWTLPPSWREVETTAQMRIATLMTESGLEVAVTAFPGDVGGLVANVNRWRGQIGLEPTDEQGVEESIERLEGFDVIVVDLTGESKRLVGTTIDVGDGNTWFVKVIGDPDSVGAVKSDLVTLSKTFHYHGADHTDHSGHDHGDGDGHDHSEHADEPAASSPSQASSGQGSSVNSVREQWEPPAEWKTDTNASQILSAAYLADDGARITLTALGGQGGGLFDNINRWRGQVGLPAVESLKDQPMKDLGDGAIIVDLISEDGSSRIVCGVVPAGAQTLFFKLTGSKDQVDAEMERFEAFVNQVGLGKRG